MKFIPVSELANQQHNSEPFKLISDGRDPISVSDGYRPYVGDWIMTDMEMKDMPDTYKYGRVYAIYGTQEEADEDSDRTGCAPVGPLEACDIKNFRVFDGKLWFRVLDKNGNVLP